MWMMSRNLVAFRLICLITFSCLALARGPAQGAGSSDGQTSPAVDLAATLPDGIQPQMSALGSRLKSRDKDAPTFQGQFVQGNSPGKAAKVTVQVPQGFARLDGFLPGDTP